ncbi:uncharacterized protein STEHIDRAFT_62896 [Stereum hirsutum FP-91666 SS1]|uniref:uncharacterized protein n=1 Tax=Stereum hirsutum (strain FP-91666) TaxID=721885 RepID=UPI0004449EE0|nr:uncharacterized protein STEHIDRAFT_62896 [Stereum hirsutum FP-91666 SS1]EIM83342.1 hypothetical protein STEHIDRAFT_62896 [Stereum hirsutum FP-91666 SS1]
MQPILYEFHKSVWSAAAELAYDELDMAGKVDRKVIDLRAGENFDPEYIKIAPNATIPALAADGKVYDSTKSSIEWMVEHSSVKVAPGSSLVDKLHEDALDPNFAFVASRNEEELQAKANGLPGASIKARLGYLKKHSESPGAAPYSSFYERKIAQVGGLVALLNNQVPETAKSGFFARSTALWDNIAAFLSTTLPALLEDKKVEEGNFIGGERPGVDDYHLGAWLARISFAQGAKGGEDAMEVLGKNLVGKPVDRRVSAYWKAWVSRESWKKVYEDGLH